MPRADSQTPLPTLVAKLPHALAVAGLTPEQVDATVSATPGGIEVRLLADGGRDVTLEQLVTIAAVLRAAEPGAQAITAHVLT